jgi:hypothetical protein
VNNLDGRQLVLPANIFLYVRLARSVLAFLGGPSAANSGVTSLAEHAPSRLARDVTQNAPAETSQDDGVEHSIQEKDDERKIGAVLLKIEQRAKIPSPKIKDCVAYDAYRNH